MIHRQHDAVERLNDKHSAELLAVARSLGGHPEATSARADRVDPLGIDLLLVTPTGRITARVLFTEPVTDPRWMRAAFVDLVGRARSALEAAGDG